MGTEEAIVERNRFLERGPRAIEALVLECIFL